MSSTVTKKPEARRATTKKASITPIYEVEVMKGKKVFKIGKSPTKKFIESFSDDYEEFNINKMLHWDAKNVLMYTRYVHKNFEDPPVLMNIMMMDRQLQKLEENYKTIASIRDDEKVFSEMMHYLKGNFVLISKESNDEIKRINPESASRSRAKPSSVTQYSSTKSNEEYCKPKFNNNGVKNLEDMRKSAQEGTVTSSNRRNDEKIETLSGTRNSRMGTSTDTLPALKVPKVPLLRWQLKDSAKKDELPVEIEGVYGQAPTISSRLRKSSRARAARRFDSVPADASTG